MPSHDEEYPFPHYPRYNNSLFSPDGPEPEDGLSMSSLFETLKEQRRTKGISTATKIVIAVIVTILLAGLMKTSRPSKAGDHIPFSSEAANDYLANFQGHRECGVTSANIYLPPSFIDTRVPKHKVFCPDRKRLLEAMAGGGRAGFDTPYMPRGCHYRWYSTAEICMILERFDSVVFIGDDMLKYVYAAFNMLLREDVALGGLKQWDMGDSDKDACRCDAQITNAKCAENLVADSRAVAGNDGQSGTGKSPYQCNQTPHFFLPISGSPAPDELHDRFTSLLKGDPDSYKPIPVIHTLGLSTSLSWPDATASMDEWVSMADASGRNVPFLWVGPNAAGHLKPPTQILTQGNNALWHYTVEMTKEAHSRDLDALGMYNLTLQATSWDGSSYGLHVGLVQAMMIINWLARVEST